MDRRRFLKSGIVTSLLGLVGVDLSPPRRKDEEVSTALAMVCPEYDTCDGVCERGVCAVRLNAIPEFDASRKPVYLLVKRDDIEKAKRIIDRTYR
jgi:hypothetical protein